MKNKKKTEFKKNQNTESLSTNFCLCSTYDLFFISYLRKCKTRKSKKITMHSNENKNALH